MHTSTSCPTDLFAFRLRSVGFLARLVTTRETGPQRSWHPFHRLDTSLFHANSVVPKVQEIYSRLLCQLQSGNDNNTMTRISQFASTADVEISSNATTNRNKHCGRKTSVDADVDKPYRSSHWYRENVIGHAGQYPHAASAATMMATRTSR